MGSVSQPDVFFYIPAAFWPNDLPPDAASNWPGFGLGIYAWTIQTYLRLRDAGVRCDLVNQLPSRGIVFLHRNGFRSHPQGIEVQPERLMVCFQGDLLPHPDAQVHVVQNQTQASIRRQAFFMPHWPQPGLQPRDKQRGDRFETIAFFGHADNLLPAFAGSDWAAALQQLGLTWASVTSQNRWNEHQTLNTQWHDYCNVDAVLAVRSFDRATLAQTQLYRHKPATKLYNAWLAGVPAILGPESAYQAERQTDMDYIEVTSVANVLQILQRLKEDAALRQAMVRNGWVRSHAITPDSLTQQWNNFLQDSLWSLYDRWCRQSHWQQRLQMHYSRLNYGKMRLQQRLRDWQYAEGRQSRTQS